MPTGRVPNLFFGHVSRARLAGHPGYEALDDGAALGRADGSGALHPPPPFSSDAFRRWSSLLASTSQRLSAWEEAHAYVVTSRDLAGGLGFFDPSAATLIGVGHSDPSRVRTAWERLREVRATLQGVLSDETAGRDTREEKEESEVKEEEHGDSRCGPPSAPFAEGVLPDQDSHPEATRSSSSTFSPLSRCSVRSLLSSPLAPVPPPFPPPPRLLAPPPPTPSSPVPASFPPLSESIRQCVEASARGIGGVRTRWGSRHEAAAVADVLRALGPRCLVREVGLLVAAPEHTLDQGLQNVLRRGEATAAPGGVKRLREGRQGGTGGGGGGRARKKGTGGGGRGRARKKGAGGDRTPCAGSSADQDAAPKTQDATTTMRNEDDADDNDDVALRARESEPHSEVAKSSTPIHFPPLASPRLPPLLFGSSPDGMLFPKTLSAVTSASARSASRDAFHAQDADLRPLDSRLASFARLPLEIKCLCPFRERGGPHGGRSTSKGGSTRRTVGPGSGKVQQKNQRNKRKGKGKGVSGGASVFGTPVPETAAASRPGLPTAATSSSVTAFDLPSLASALPTYWSPLPAPGEQPFPPKLRAEWIPQAQVHALCAGAQATLMAVCSASPELPPALYLVPRDDGWLRDALGALAALSAAATPPPSSDPRMREQTHRRMLSRAAEMAAKAIRIPTQCDQRPGTAENGTTSIGGKPPFVPSNAWALPPASPRFPPAFRQAPFLDAFLGNAEGTARGEESDEEENADEEEEGDMEAK